ncbi:MAG: hypothetical protein ACJ70O_03020 [Nitrososphaera sp.]
MTYYSIIILGNIIPYIVVALMKLVDENTMTLNSSRRIAGRSKEEVITGAEH